MEKQKSWKMKLIGYLCILFAAVLSVIILIPDMLKDAEALPVIYYWGGLGLALVFGNAGKQLGGYAVMNMKGQKE